MVGAAAQMVATGVQATWTTTTVTMAITVWMAGVQCRHVESAFQSTVSTIQLSMGTVLMAGATTILHQSSTISKAAPMALGAPKDLLVKLHCVVGRFGSQAGAQGLREEGTCWGCRCIMAWYSLGRVIQLLTAISSLAAGVPAEMQLAVDVSAQTQLAAGAAAEMQLAADVLALRRQGADV